MSTPLFPPSVLVSGDYAVVNVARVWPFTVVVIVLSVCIAGVGRSLLLVSIWPFNEQLLLLMLSSLLFCWY